MALTKEVSTVYTRTMDTTIGVNAMTITQPVTPTETVSACHTTMMPVIDTSGTKSSKNNGNTKLQNNNKVPD